MQMTYKIHLGEADASWDLGKDVRSLDCRI